MGHIPFETPQIVPVFWLFVFQGNPPTCLHKRHTLELNRMSYEVGDATVGKTHLLSYTYGVMKMRKNFETAVEL